MLGSIGNYTKLNRILLPDGKSIVPERQQGADAQGRTLMVDRFIVTHWAFAKTRRWRNESG
jgi:hypothetical protein